MRAARFEPVRDTMCDQSRYSSAAGLIGAEDLPEEDPKRHQRRVDALVPAEMDFLYGLGSRALKNTPPIPTTFSMRTPFPRAAERQSSAAGGLQERSTQNQPEGPPVRCSSWFSVLGRQFDSRPFFPTCPSSPFSR